METTPNNQYPNPTDPAMAGRVIAGCRLIELIGSGGMGAVWKAHHQALDVPVAVKLLLPALGSELYSDERLLREARATARLRHPHIVGVLNVGQDEGLPFLVMEWVDGQSLQKHLETHGRLPIPEAIRFTKQVLSALELTNQHGIVHRDIKPDNLLIDTDGNIKLVDLGLAKQLGVDVSLTQTGAVMGSPYYIAPEQASNSKAVDGRADIYSLGCTLYHMLAGTPPYAGTTYLEIILKHIQEPLADLSQVDPTFPPPLVGLVARMMAKDPAERFSSPQEVMAALVAWDKGTLLISKQLPQSIKARPWHLIVLGGIPVLAFVGWLLFRPGVSDPAIVPVAVAPAVKEAPVTTTVPPKEKRPRREVTPLRRTPKVASKEKQQEPQSGAPMQFAPGTSTLSEALVRRDTDRLRWLLDRGTSPNAPNGTVSPLHQAVALGEAGYVRMLLEKGANPNALDSLGETPLVKAMHRGNREMGGALLDFGANPNLRDRAGYTPLQLAGGDAFWRRKLLEKGAN